MRGVLAKNSNSDEAIEDLPADEIEDLILEDISRQGAEILALFKEVVA